MTQRISYREVDLPIPSTFDAAHNRFWQRLQKPGSWWTAQQRIAIAAEGRAASHCRLCRRRKNALSANAVSGEHDTSRDSSHRSNGLPPVAIDVIHRVMTDSSRLTHAWYQSILEQGLTPEEYVEIIGTLVALKSIDSFTQALGLPLNELPTPIPDTTHPNHYRPNAILTDAWVPMIEADANTEAEADLWPAGMNAYVIRAMSLVPDEVRTLNDLSAVHYLPNEKVGDPAARGENLSRAQMELVAGRVSALNQCFY